MFYLCVIFLFLVVVVVLLAICPEEEGGPDRKYVESCVVLVVTK